MTQLSLNPQGASIGIPASDCSRPSCRRSTATGSATSPRPSAIGTL